MRSPFSKLCSLAAALLVLAGVNIRAAAPGSSFDLSHWKLTLPLDDAGGITGEATEVKNPALQTYSSEFFYTGTDGATVFWCPVIGATTSGATAPRTELREQMVAGSSSINWSALGTHILRGQCRVTQLPDTGAVIIGQVHGYPSQRLIKLQQDATRVQVYIRTSLADGGDTKFTWNIATNTLLNYEIKVVDGEAFITVNGVTNRHSFLGDDPAWATITYYFKAGAYLQDNAGPLTEGGRVSFYQLSVTHGTNPPPVPPVITMQPASESVAAGTNVTLSVTADGTAPLAFQWRTNGVNWPGRTNASITVMNFRAADQRAYDVRVSNSAGAATSAVARLYLNNPVRFLQSRRAGGVFTTTFIGVIGSNYIFETSTDLLRWTPVLTNRPVHGLVEFSQTNSSSSVRFYRVR
jgi:hypothetical protein